MLKLQSIQGFYFIVMKELNEEMSRSTGGIEKTVRLWAPCPHSSGPEVCDWAQEPGEPTGGRGGRAAHTQADSHGGEWTAANGGGGTAGRHSRRRWRPDRNEGGGQWVHTLRSPGVWSKSSPPPRPHWLLLCHPRTARAQAAELRFSQLKERHAELITSHADLMKKVGQQPLCSFQSWQKSLHFFLS